MNNCFNCNSEIVEGLNVFTESGKREYEISKLCEICFDSITVPLYENLYDPECLDQDIVSLCKDNVVLAGGAMRKLVSKSDTLCDYDLFVTDLSKIDPLRESLVSSGFSLVFKCPEGKLYTYKKSGVKVQVINNRPYSDLKDIISSFDIRASCCAYSDGKIEHLPGFVSDVLNKNIFINKVEYPKATLNRIIKYSAKGYTLTRFGNSQFIESVNDIELDDDSSRFYID